MSGVKRKLADDGSQSQSTTNSADSKRGIMAGIHIVVIQHGLTGYKVRYDALRRIATELGAVVCDMLPPTFASDGNEWVVLSDLAYEKILAQLKLDGDGNGDKLRHVHIVRPDWLAQSKIKKARIDYSLFVVAPPHSLLLAATSKDDKSFSSPQPFPGEISKKELSSRLQIAGINNFADSSPSSKNRDQDSTTTTTTTPTVDYSSAAGSKQQIVHIIKQPVSTTVAKTAAILGHKRDRSLSPDDPLRLLLGADAAHSPPKKTSKTTTTTSSRRADDDDFQRQQQQDSPLRRRYSDDELGDTDAPTTTKQKKNKPLNGDDSGSDEERGGPRKPLNQLIMDELGVFEIDAKTKF